MWERRYGFPKPGRDENGERQYTLAEIAKLRAIKRLMDVGDAARQDHRAVAGRAQCDGRRPGAGARRDAAARRSSATSLAMLKTHDVTPRCSTRSPTC